MNKNQEILPMLHSYFEKDGHKYTIKCNKIQNRYLSVLEIIFLKKIFFKFFSPQFIMFSNCFFHFLNYITILSAIGTGIADSIFLVFFIFIGVG